MQTFRDKDRQTNRLIRSMSAAVALCSLGAGIALAQSPAATPVSPATMDFRAYMSAPANPAALSASDSSYSSSSSANVDAPDPGASASASASLMGGAAGQPPPRRRYGRPNYADSHTNADGSPKWTFVAGAGFTVPVATTSDDLTPGYRFQVGGGRNFNKKFGVLLQFDYDHFGFQNSTLNRILAVYQAIGVQDGFGDGLPISQLGGNSHVWSFTLNPIYNITQGDNWGSYVVGGVGFYHKVADFTTPGAAEACTFYGCFEYTANQVVDAYVSNAPGISAGGGVTYKFSRFTSEKLFAEVRYVRTFNSARPYYDGLNDTPPPSGTSATYFNVFPQNSYDTSYIPVTFGIRF